MTQKELARLGITEEELNALIKEMKERLNSGTLKLIQEGLPSNFKEQLLAIRFRRSTGKTNLETVTPEIASIIKQMVKAVRVAESQTDALPLA